MMPVLQKLSIPAFRGISGLVLEDLTPVSLVVGANNAGKSSILEATALLLRPSDRTQWIHVVRHRDTDMALVDGLWSLFPRSEAAHPELGPQQSQTMLLEGVTSSGPRKVEAHCTLSQSVEANGDTELFARIDVSVDSQPAVALRFPGPAVSAPEVRSFRVFGVTPATHYSTKTMVEHLSRVVDEGKKQLAVELLRIFDEGVTDIDVVGGSEGIEAVRVTHSERGVVDLSTFGDGMRRSAALALTLTRASQGVLLIDEIEGGTHHTLLQPVLSKLVEAAETSQVQILATTHSQEAVDAVMSCVEERNTLAILSAFWAKREGRTHAARRYDYDKLRVLREGGMDIR